ncbi:TPA: hypothetical protein N2A34_003141 [Pseudomonas aeruginosa]|nr:hypothetical protein [Pseudomonas aeruginosa]
MVTYKIKRVLAPLFGMIEVREQEPWLTIFANSKHATNISIDDDALNLIAEELGIDARGLKASVDLYVKGEHFERTRGLSPAQIGEIGEVLTYLTHCAMGDEIVRVVSWKQGASPKVKGSKFPQPDFILNNGTGMAALEVKSTALFDYEELKDPQKKWTHLKPCTEVKPCRSAALPQLGYVGNARTPQKHSLELKDKSIVPFPVGKGVAVAVLAIDGKINRIRDDRRLRTPPACKMMSRNCWSCIPESDNFVLVTMPNNPGRLSLGGALNDRSYEWLAKYKRWTQALKSRDILAVRHALGELVSAVSYWQPKESGRKASLLRAFWGSYLSDAMRSQGINIAPPEDLGSLAQPEFDYEWNLSKFDGPEGLVTSLNEIKQVFYGNDDIDFMMSSYIEGQGKSKNSITVRGVGQTVELSLVSDTWWTGDTVRTGAGAQAIGGELINFILEAFSANTTGADFELYTKPIVAEVDQNRVLLGWKVYGYAPMLRSNNYPSEIFYIVMLLLEAAHIDDGFYITVDGRASLKISRRFLESLKCWRDIGLSN